MAHAPDDFTAMFQEEIDRHVDPRGILPIELQKASYSMLDRLVQAKLADQGLKRCTVEEYRAALVEVVDELLTKPRKVTGGVRGTAVAERADQLLETRGETCYKAYAEALCDAQRAVDLEGRSDLLAAIRERLIAIRA